MTRTDARPKLRHRITLPELTYTTNDLGEKLAGYSGGVTVWAMVEPLGAEARMRAERRGQTVTHRITIRWRTGLTASHRLAWTHMGGARWMRIKTVYDPDERHEWLVLECEDEGDAQA